MPYLQYLDLANNSMDLNVQFDNEQFPNLFFLYLSGNNVLSFPGKSLKNTVQDLGVARCNLHALPLYLSEFKVLVYFDARNNNISTVDSDLKVLIKSNKIESYFSNNVVCKSDKSIDCKPLCSKYCWSRNALKNGKCDITCNTESCNFDGGECK